MGKKPAPKAGKGKARKAGPKPKAMNMSKPSYNTSFASVSNTHKAMAAYFNGLVDPALASRGPGGNEDAPTIVVPFHSKTSLKIAGPGVLADGPDASMDVAGNITAGNHSADSGGTFAFVTTPCWAESKSGTTVTGDGFYSGYSIRSYHAPGNQNFNQASVLTDSPANVFAGFDNDFPLNATKYNTSDWGTDPTIVFNAGYRCVGLRTTVTVTSAAMTASGDVYCGDNMDFYHSSDGQAVAYKGNDDLVESNDYARNPLLSQNFDNGVHYSRVMSAGAVKNASVYEATWLPTTDKALDFQHRVKAQVLLDPTDVGATSDGSTPAQTLLNQPALIWFINGIPADGLSITIKTTVSMEIQVKRGTAIGFLLANALYMPRYLPPWRAIQCCPTGGKNGAACGMWGSTPGGALHAAVSASRATPARGTPPPNTGIGADPPPQRFKARASAPRGEVTATASGHGSWYETAVDDARAVFNKGKVIAEEAKKGFNLVKEIGEFFA